MSVNTQIVVRRQYMCKRLELSYCLIDCVYRLLGHVNTTEFR